MIPVVKPLTSSRPVIVIVIVVVIVIVIVLLGRARPGVSQWGGASSRQVVDHNSAQLICFSDFYLLTDKYKRHSPAIFYLTRWIEAMEKDPAVAQYALPTQVYISCKHDTIDT